MTLQEYTPDERENTSSTASTLMPLSFSSTADAINVAKKPSLGQWIVPIIGILLAVVAYFLTKGTQNGYISYDGKNTNSEYLELLEIPEYDEEEALRHIFYSKAAFCTERAIASWSCGEICDNAPVVGNDKIRYIPEGQRFQVQGYVAQIPGNNDLVRSNVLNFDDNPSNENGRNDDIKCMVSFRGSLKPANWYADFLLMLRPWPLNDLSGVDWCQGCKAHHGFAQAYDEIRTDVHRAIEDLNCTRLVLAGHSLGGAIATIASFDLRAAIGYHVEATWTFGKPRIGNAEFVISFVAAATAQGISPPIWRVIHYHDPIPRAPPHLPGVHPVAHGPLEIYYTNRASSEFTVCPQHGATENQSKSCMAGWPLYLSLNLDHIDYLNQSFAFKNFPDECKATE